MMDDDVDDGTGMPEAPPEGDVDVDDNDARDDDPETEPAELAQVKKVRKPRVKLDIAFFRGEAGEDPQDKMWDMFLDIVEPFPTYQEKQLQETLDESTQISFHRSLLLSLGGKQRISDEDMRRREMKSRAAHLDSMLKRLRNWEQNEYPYGLSMRDFGQKIQKVSLKREFLDYRAELIHKYKTTDWRELGAARRRQQQNQGVENVSPKVAPTTDTSSDFGPPDDFEEFATRPPTPRQTPVPVQLNEQQMAEIQNKREAYMRAMRERNLSKKNDNVAQSPTNSMTLTVEQKQQIEENRRRAMEKRSATVTAEQQQQIEENRRKAIEKRLERVNLGNSMEE
eukprot:Selendium_serpulae@DN6298_c0_g1_i5.p1